MKNNNLNLNNYDAGAILQGILQSISEVASAKNLDTLLIMLSGMAHRLVSSDRCTVWVYDDLRNILWSKVADGVDRIETSADSGVVGYVFRTHEPVIINDPYADRRFNPHIDEKTGYRTNNIIAIPLTNINGEIVGVFQALNKLDGAGYTISDLKLLQFVTVYIAREIDGAILRHELEETQKEIIYTLAETGEMRSKETGNHVKRVAEYCNFIAQQLSLSELDQEMITIASSLHDIGKIAIPDKVLLKPGRLTPDERIIIETHAQLGYEMLKHSKRSILKAAATIAHEHHEKWNGSGYPQRLAGSDIHIFGRIAAVADVYDALACERCYKKAWEHERVVKLFQEEKGKHFDPMITDIFLDNQKIFTDIGYKYRDEI